MPKTNKQKTHVSNQVLTTTNYTNQIFNQYQWFGLFKSLLKVKKKKIKQHQKRENEYTFNYDTFCILCFRKNSIYLTNKVYEGFTFHFHALEKEMATHSSVLAWRIPGTGSLVGCRLWDRRVGHDWSDLTTKTTTTLLLFYPNQYPKKYIWYEYKSGIKRNLPFL